MKGTIRARGVCLVVREHSPLSPLAPGPRREPPYLPRIKYRKETDYHKIYAPSKRSARRVIARPYLEGILTCAAGHSRSPISRKYGRRLPPCAGLLPFGPVMSLIRPLSCQFALPPAWSLFAADGPQTCPEKGPSPHLHLQQMADAKPTSNHRMLAREDDPMYLTGGLAPQALGRAREKARSFPVYSDWKGSRGGNERPDHLMAPPLWREARWNLAQKTCAVVMRGPSRKIPSHVGLPQCRRRDG